MIPGDKRKNAQLREQFNASKLCPGRAPVSCPVLDIAAAFYMALLIPVLPFIIFVFLPPSSA